MMKMKRLLLPALTLLLTIQIAPRATQADFTELRKRIKAPLVYIKLK
jgi:hypothetical protein